MNSALLEKSVIQKARDQLEWELQFYNKDSIAWKARKFMIYRLEHLGDNE